ncbi:MAG: V-type ATP synthase subunit E [Candidatus Cloacimonetes bacterium HGW-Cloacimonetes-3]|jgi:V/A-type H+-transporting ATPase subunit E|nr:MAG: V-type ATP synthase subunit E [Candidatus Cloacimonetes bacterium HGW-Cloacimonetes-3]
MSDQLQDLLKRVYDEGVAKANAEAESILSEAKSKAEEIINKATLEAENSLKIAAKESADLKKNTDSDLQMAANHSLSALKQKAIELILDKAISEKLNNTFNDIEFMQKLIIETLSAWKANAGTGNIVISESMKPQLDEFFIKSLKDIFKGELNVDFSPLMKQGFQISPADGSYRLSFTDEDFANLFKSYLRPRSKEILFGN